MEIFIFVQYEIFKFFHVLERRTCANMKEAQSIFMVQITNTLNFINVTILTVNVFSVSILLRRNIIKSIEEVI